jgi:hypothetical protein
MNHYKYSQSWFIEIGCFEGLSSIFFVDNFIDNQQSSLTCVDPFLNITDNDHSNYLQNNEEINFDCKNSNCKNSDIEHNNQIYNFIYIYISMVAIN